MKKTRFAKRLLSFALALLFMLSAFWGLSYESVKADDDYEIMPCFTTIVTEKYAITINGLQAIVSGSLIPAYKTSLQITLELQKYTSGSWKTDKMWVATAYDVCLITEGKKLINIFSDYRLKVTFKADQETSVRYRYPSD